MESVQNKDVAPTSHRDNNMPELEKALTRPPNPPVILTNKKVQQPKRPLQRKRGPSVKRQKAVDGEYSNASNEPSTSYKIIDEKPSQSENASISNPNAATSGSAIGKQSAVNVATRMAPIAKKTQGSVRKPGKVAAVPRLLPGTSPANSHRSSLYNSPMVENVAGEPYVLSDYICKKSGLSKPVKQSVLTEHTYSKPHNWLPEHTHMRPVRYLFTEKPSEIKKQTKLDAVQSDEMVDIELVDGDITMPGGESWRSGSVWRTDDGTQPKSNKSDAGKIDEEDANWEDTIPREGWSAGQQRLFNSVTSALDALELRALVSAGGPGEGTTMRTAYDMHANDLRYHLINCNHDLRIPIWLHLLLIEKLPPHLKYHYKQLLARVKKAIPGIVEAMLKTAAPFGAMGRAASGANINPNIELPSVPPDPVAEQLVREKFKRLPHAPVFLVVPDDHRMHRQPRFNLFTTMLHQMGAAFTVPLSQAPDGSSVSAGLELKTSETRRHLAELRSRTAGTGRDICLVGFGTGAAVAALAAVAEPTIHALVCLGFPACTLEGVRGKPDDSVLNVRAPTLFVTGEHDVTSSVSVLEAMRSRMSVYTQLVVIGSADDRLVVPRQKLITMGLTQAMIDKAILVEIHNFIGGILANPGSTTIPPKIPAAKRMTDEAKSSSRRYIKKQNKSNGGTNSKILAMATATPIISERADSKSSVDIAVESLAKRKVRLAVGQQATTDGPTVVPGLWQSKYKSPMLSPVPDKTRRNVSAPPSPTTASGSVPMALFATPSLPTASASSQAPSASTSAPAPLISTPLPPGCYNIDTSSKLLKVLTSRPRIQPPPSKVMLIGDNSLNVTSKIVKINSQKFTPLTADSILNLPIIFAKDDDNIFQLKETPAEEAEQAEEEINIPVMDSEKIVNKFEFSKPQPGVKYRKIVLSRMNDAEDAGTSVPTGPRLLGSVRHVKAVSAPKRKNLIIEHKEHDYE